MWKFAGILLVAAATAGCSTVDIRRVVELEQEVARLEAQLADMESSGSDPAGLAVPRGLGREIESLSVSRPYVETVVAVFPGFLFPGLGAHAIGDTETGWNRLGEAYTGALEFTIGTGMTLSSIAVIGASCTAQDPHAFDALGEWFVTGVAYMVTGPVHYFESWFGDIASTYYAREDLAARVEILKSRYRLFVRDYEKACRAYGAREGGK